MTTLPLFPETNSSERSERTVMNGKPVLNVPAKSVINLKSGFRHKLLCDGPTFSTGSACAYSCSFCYVPDLMRKSPHLHGVTQKHEDIVIRRKGALGAMRSQLVDSRGRPRFPDPADRRVIYASPLVDVAANLDLVAETIEACNLILELTHWDIRLLSKSNLLPKIAAKIPEKHAQRVIYGVSTGTLDDKLAGAFEAGTARVSKRLDSLYWLQDHGFRTFGMICPSLPLPSSDPDGIARPEAYRSFARSMHAAVRADRCEHVWGEVLNARGDSMTRTLASLHGAGFHAEADALAKVSSDEIAWEAYARSTFEAHADLYPAGKLRFLQYVTKDTQQWWADRKEIGAILL